MSIRYGIVPPTPEHASGVFETVCAAFPGAYVRDDADPMYRVTARDLQDHFAHIREETLGRYAQAFADPDARDIRRVALDAAGHLLGYAWVRHPLETGSVPELRSMYVRPEAQGMGLGTALFRDAVPECGDALVKVAAHNAAARAAYVRWGFSPEARPAPDYELPLGGAAVRKVRCVALLRPHGVPLPPAPDAR